MRRRGGEPLHVYMPREMKSRPNTSPTQSGPCVMPQHSQRRRSIKICTVRQNGHSVYMAAQTLQRANDTPARAAAPNRQSARTSVCVHTHAVCQPTERSSYSPRTVAMGTWCSGITSASHAEGPGFNAQCVHVKRHGRLQYDYSARASLSAANFRHTLQGFLPQGARVQCLTSRTLHARAGVVLWAVVVWLGTAAEEKQWRPQSTRDSVRKRRQQSDARDFFLGGLYDFAQTVSKSANKKTRKQHAERKLNEMTWTSGSNATEIAVQKCVRNSSGLAWLFFLTEQYKHGTRLPAELP